MVDILADQSELAAGEEMKPIGFRRWAWEPWYGKAWWGLALIYWVLRGLSYKLGALDWMNEPGFSGYFVVAFFPPIMLFTLAFGVLKARLNTLPANDPLAEGAYDEFRRSDLFDPVRGPSGLPYSIDPLDPRSGAFWIGNPLNPLNAAYINRGS
jgi:hypothetical protein